MLSWPPRTSSSRRMVVITAPSRLSRVSGPVRLTRTRPGSRSRTRVTISAASVVLPVPPIPYITMPASRRTGQVGGPAALLAPPPDEVPVLPPGQPGDPRPGRLPARPARCGPGPEPVPTRLAARTVTAAHSPSPASSVSRLSGEVSSSAWTSRRASARAATTSGLPARARVAVHAGQQPGGVGVGDRGLGGDHRRRAALAQLGRERGPVLAGRRVGVAGRQGDHRRHPARRDRLVQRTPRR